jgi:MioC protein
MLSEAVIILVATMGGTATFVAEEMAAALSTKGIKAFVVDMSKAELAMFAKRSTYIICSSSCGTGDIPDNGKQFYATLVNSRPDLSHVRFGTVALGDMTYSASFYEIFGELGAQRLIPRLEHDRQSGEFPEDAAVEWLDDWLEAASR